MLFNSDRRFQLWQYLGDRRQLCVRSNSYTGQPTNLDLVFEGVEYVALPTILKGIELTEDPFGQDGLPFLKVSTSPATVYALISEGHRFVVVARSYYVSENDWDFWESPLEQTLRPRDIEVEPVGIATPPLPERFYMVIAGGATEALPIVDCLFKKWLDSSWVPKCALIEIDPVSSNKAQLAQNVVISPRYLPTMSDADEWSISVRVSSIVNFDSIEEGRAPSADVRPLYWAKIFRSLEEATEFGARYARSKEGQGI